MDESELPTVHLNEKMLRNIRERQSLDNKDASCSKTPSARKSRKTPKHGFYQAGVTRLSNKRENQVASSRENTKSAETEGQKRDLKVTRKRNEEGNQSSQFDKAPEEEKEITSTVDKRVEQKGGRNSRQAERQRGGRGSRQQTSRTLYEPIDEDRRVHRTTRKPTSASKTRPDYPPRVNKQTENVPPKPVVIENRSVEDLLKESDFLKSMLDTHISKNTSYFTQYQLDSFLKSREDLMHIYKEIILKDIIFTNNHTIDQRLWKNVFYHVVEMVRRRISHEIDEDEKEKIQTTLMNILQHAASFYLELIEDLSKRHRLNLSCFSPSNDSPVHATSSGSQNKKRPSKHAKMALMSCQRMLLSLGDVHRYMACVKDNNNFGEARRWYARARHVEPRNGRPYNQLALLAVLTKRNFEAVYFYMRSLAPVGTPILTARESLIALFNESRRKLEYLHSQQTTSKEKVKNCTKNVEKTVNNNHTGDANQHMWIKPSYTSNLADVGTIQQHENTSTDDDINKNDDRTHADDEEEPVENFTSKKLKKEVYKKFILIFLNVHGVIFTRIGHDSFDELKTRSFHLLTQLLEDNRTKLTVEILVNIFVINAYSVFDQFNKAGAQGNGDEAPVLPVQAIEYSFGILNRICKQATKLLQRIENHIRDESNDSNDSIHESVDKVESLLAYIKVSFDWMYANKSMWCKDDDPSACEPCTSVLMQSMAVLCDRVTYFVDHTAFGINITRQNGNDSSKKVVLPEDHEVLGFAPIQPLDGDSEQAYVDEYDMSNNSLLVYISARLHYINDFLQYLCGREKPLLAFKDGSYISLIQASRTCANNLNSDASTTNSLNDSFTSDDGLVVNVMTHPHHTTGSDELRLLKDYRNSLQMTKKNQQKRFDVISKSLADARHVVETLRVEPRYLVPDTNCFIDHLPLIESVLKHGYYTICVPLVVLVELKGLAALCKTTTDEKHATYVNLRAKSAVKFLQYSFENKSSDKKLPFDQHRCLKLEVLTNQGSELKNLNFVCEEASDRANNDDLILQCCVKYEMKNRQYHRTVWNNDNNVDEAVPPITHRTVLLSDDRNLRVKSHAQNMPTRTLPNFYKWAAFADS